MTLHNVAYLFGLVEQVRSAIERGTLGALRDELRTAWVEPAR